MGLIGYVARRLVLASAFFLLIVLLPGLPPSDVTFTQFSANPVSPLKGVYSLNSKLNGAKRLFENELKGPEGLLVYKNELYTGVHGGQILKILNDKQFVSVLKFGKTCAGLWEEDKCGRVLGMAVDKTGAFYIVDAYYGLFKANITTGAHERLVAIDEIIEGKPVKLPNSIDVASDGTIYWSVSSTTHKLYDGVYTLIADGTGRLIKTDLKKKTHEVLIDNLYFANGVVLSEDESFVLVGETGNSRVLRYHLKGPKKGTKDVFIEGLPGLPDNLKRDNKGGFFIPLVAPVDTDKPHIGALLGPYPLIGHFESIDFVRSERVTIVRVDSKGNVVESLHGTDGKISGICDIEYFKGAYYLASPFNPYLGKIVAKQS